MQNLKESEEGLREGYERRIIQQQKEVDELRKQLREAEQTNTPVPPKMSKKTVRSYVPELRAILNQEIPAAAEAIRRLTGPISIRQEAIPEKTRGARWIATFSPRFTGTFAPCRARKGLSRFRDFGVPKAWKLDSAH